MARLESNIVELAEKPRPIDYASPSVTMSMTQRFLEASYMHKCNGKYYYSYTNYKNKEHQGFYAIGDSPYGPFAWKVAFAPARRAPSSIIPWLNSKGNGTASITSISRRSCATIWDWIEMGFAASRVSTVSITTMTGR